VACWLNSKEQGVRDILMFLYPFVHLKIPQPSSAKNTDKAQSSELHGFVCHALGPIPTWQRPQHPSGGYLIHLVIFGYPQSSFLSLEQLSNSYPSQESREDSGKAPRCKYHSTLRVNAYPQQ
jgi:hypothetical protein